MRKHNFKTRKKNLEAQGCHLSSILGDIPEGKKKLSLGNLSGGKGVVIAECAESAFYRGFIKEI